MAKLTVLLPAARDRCGRAVLTSRDGAVLFGPFRVLGTASRHAARHNGNRAHARTLPFGDPPTGTYRVLTCWPPGPAHPRRPGRFGRVGALVADGVSGEAREGARRGRPPLLLHGGPLGTSGRLRRTRGGLRASNADLGRFFLALNGAQDAGDPVTELEIIDVPALVIEGEARIARGRRVRRAPRKGARRAAPSPTVGVAAALALFGVRGGTLTRRRFLGAALLAVGGLALPACDQPAQCIPPRCDPNVEPCPKVPCDDYGAGGGVG